MQKYFPLAIACDALQSIFFATISLQTETGHLRLISETKLQPYGIVGAEQLLVDKLLEAFRPSSFAAVFEEIHP